MIYVDSLIPFFMRANIRPQKLYINFLTKKKHLILGCYIYGGLPELKLQCYDKFKYTRE